ncbi:MAG: hypothetical protein ACMG57_03280 [Candidatus Dojkabacteria bacterium]
MREGRINKQLLFLFIAMALLTFTSLLILFLNKSTVSRIPVSSPVSNPVSYFVTWDSTGPGPDGNTNPLPPTPQTQEPVAGTLRYRNDDLNILDVLYPDTWTFKVKTLEDTSSMGFASARTGECLVNCMGISLTKGDLSIKMIINKKVADEMYQPICSNTAEVTYLDHSITYKSWARIKSSLGYIYTRDYSDGLTPAYYTPAEYGVATDEWSYVGGQPYKICLFGNFTGGYSKVEYDASKGPVGFLMENLEYPLSTKLSDIEQIDEIVGKFNF